MSHDDVNPIPAVAMPSSSDIFDAAQMTDRVWDDLCAAGHAAAPLVSLPEPWAGLFGPLVAPLAAAGTFVIAQIGQSLDGRIATPTGHSHYVNGPAAIAHLHRLRALVDAVVIGVGTALADDPQLTVRYVAGRNPARVVIDPSGRLHRSAKVLTQDDCRRFIVTKQSTQMDLSGDAEILHLPAGSDGKLAPSAILTALAGRGLRRILVEGGPTTISGFLSAGCLDRLHVAVAPLLIGSGPHGLDLPPIDRLDAAQRPRTRVYRLGDDMLFDCELTRR